MRRVLLVLVLVAGCTEAALVPPDGLPPGPRDNKLRVGGRVCTTDPADVVFPLKVLFVIDTSGSMNKSDPVSQTEPDPTLQTGRARAIRDVIDRYINLKLDLSGVSYCDPGAASCTKGSTTCPACGPSGSAMCVGPDCCNKPPALCAGVPTCTGSNSGTCIPLCQADTDCVALGGRCKNGICAALRDPGVEFAIMRFGSAKQVLTRNSQGLDGFTDDPRELVSAIPQVSNGGSVTDYEGALSMVYKVISADVSRMKQRGAVALARTRYLVVFLSDGRPDPQINDEDDWDRVPESTQQDLLGPGLTTAAIQEYNLPSRILQRVQEIVGLKTLHGLGDVRFHATYLAGAEEPRVADQSIYLLRQMAQVGRGTFLNFESHSSIDFLKVGFSTLRRIFALKTLIVSNLSARPVNGALETDSDADGLADGVERQAGTSIALADTDADGFSDALEHFHRGSGWDALDPGDADCPLLDDADGDGRPDDSDGDGLLDCEERILGTHRGVMDSDADGVPDGLEVRFGTNPVVDDAQDDPDMDGLANADEIRLHTDPHADDAAHRSRESYRYSLRQVGSGIERLGRTCIDDSDCPSHADCRAGFCRCVVDAACSSGSSCQVDADCVVAGERCDGGRCRDPDWTCQASPEEDPQDQPERVCSAVRHVSCYHFDVENVALLSPLPAAGESEPGWNRIQLYFGETPFDSPGEPGSYSTACIKARLLEGQGGVVKLPATGVVTVPRSAWVAPTRRPQVCVCPDGTLGC